MTALKPLSEIDLSKLLALNNVHAVELSLLDEVRLAELLAVAFYAQGIGELDAFLIAFDQAASYKSPNFLWFRQRHERFVYIDRVAVAAAARRRGLARLLYADCLSRSAAAGHRLVACEVNVRPPNPTSLAFHESLGFREVGRADLPDGGKTVSYLAKDLS